MKKRLVLLLGVLTLTTGIFAGCGKETVNEASLDEIEKGGFTVAASCHDPQICVGEDGNYYMFGSHMVGAVAEDLRKFNYFANGVDASNPLFDNLLGGDDVAFSFVGKNTDDSYSVWAPDVSWNETMGKYVMYFCTTSSYIKSNICFATADKIEGPYTYQDTILYSGYGQSDADKTNLSEVLGADADISRYFEYGGYNNKEWPNCIDPSTFTDADGKLWMVYGSWSGGIFVLELDPATGYPIHPVTNEADGVDAYYGTRIAGGGHHSIEGPYIQYDADTGYYYLFVSYGNLTSDGGYQVRQFRSENPDGPYVDAAGQTLLDQDDHFNYGLKMMGNYTFPSLNYTYMAPGGESGFLDSDGKYYLVYHTRFDDGQEYHEPRVHQMFQTENGWFTEAPFATMGETLREDGYKASEVQGTYYIVDHGTDISDKIREAEACTLTKDGTLSGEELNGTFSIKEGTDYITLTIDGTTYEGVLIDMEDEAGNPVRCFSAVGENNETLWGVQYLKNR